MTVLCFQQKNKTKIRQRHTGNTFFCTKLRIFRKKILEPLLKRGHEASKVIIYPCDKIKHFEMNKRYATSDYPNLRLFTGDVRDGSILRLAIEGIDFFHAATLKNVPTAGNNLFNCIERNYLEAQSVIQVAMH